MREIELQCHDRGGDSIPCSKVVLRVRQVTEDGAARMRWSVSIAAPGTPAQLFFLTPHSLTRLEAFFDGVDEVTER